MNTVTLSVPDISCDHCKNSIEGAVGQLPGVAEVEVAIEAKTVAVNFNVDTVTVQTITDAIEDQGYEVAPA